jgi:hypothetical protein
MGHIKFIQNSRKYLQVKVLYRYQQYLGQIAPWC